MDWLDSVNSHDGFGHLTNRLELLNLLNMDFLVVASLQVAHHHRGLTVISLVNHLMVILTLATILLLLTHQVLELVVVVVICCLRLQYLGVEWLWLGQVLFIYGLVMLNTRALLLFSARSANGN